MEMQEIQHGEETDYQEGLGALSYQAGSSDTQDSACRPPSLIIPSFTAISEYSCHRCRPASLYTLRSRSTSASTMIEHFG